MILLSNEQFLELWTHADGKSHIIFFEEITYLCEYYYLEKSK